LKFNLKSAYRLQTSTSIKRATSKPFSLVPKIAALRGCPHRWKTDTVSLDSSTSKLTENALLQTAGWRSTRRTSDGELGKYKQAATSTSACSRARSPRLAKRNESTHAPCRHTKKNLKGGNKKVATENGLLQKGSKGCTKKVATENSVYRLCTHDIQKK